MLRRESLSLESEMPKSKAKSPEELVNEMFREPDRGINDREINKQTGIWKRAEQQIGVPLPWRRARRSPPRCPAENFHRRPKLRYRRP